MEVTRSTSFMANVRRVLFNRDTYETDTGCKFTMSSSTGKVNVNEDGTITVSDAEKLKIYDSKGNDKIQVINSYIKAASIGRGQDTLYFDKCKFKGEKKFDAGAAIATRGKKNDCANIIVNGDFYGRMNLQQGAGRGYGNDDYAHKDKVIITGNNNGTVQVDGCDKVAIKGPEKGHVTNMTVYYM